MTPTPAPSRQDRARRAARRTALAVGLVALGVYVAFMLSAVLP